MRSRSGIDVAALQVIQIDLQRGGTGMGLGGLDNRSSLRRADDIRGDILARRVLQVRGGGRIIFIDAVDQIAFDRIFQLVLQIKYENDQ